MGNKEHYWNQYLAQLGLATSEKENTQRRLEVEKLHYYLSSQFAVFFPDQKNIISLDDNDANVQTRNNLLQMLRSGASLTLQLSPKKILHLQMLIDAHSDEIFIITGLSPKSKINISRQGVVRIISKSSPTETDFVSELSSSQLKKLRQFLQLLFHKAQISAQKC